MDKKGMDMKLVMTFVISAIVIVVILFIFVPNAWTQVETMLGFGPSTESETGIDLSEEYISIIRIKPSELNNQLRPHDSNWWKAEKTKIAPTLLEITFDKELSDNAKNFVTVFKSINNWNPSSSAAYNQDEDADVYIEDKTMYIRIWDGNRYYIVRFGASLKSKYGQTMNTAQQVLKFRT